MKPRSLQPFDSRCTDWSSGRFIPFAWGITVCMRPLKKRFTVEGKNCTLLWLCSHKAFFLSFVGCVWIFLHNADTQQFQFRLCVHGKVTTLRIGWTNFFCGYRVGEMRYLFLALYVCPRVCGERVTLLKQGFRTENDRFNDLKLLIWLSALLVKPNTWFAWWGLPLALMLWPVC